MNDEQARQLLPVYADGELDAAESAELERQIADSDSLREELSRWRSLRESARRVVMSAETPEGLEARVRATIGANRGAGRRLPVRVFSGVFAAAAAVALAVVFWPTQTTTAQPRTIEAARFAEVYLRCAVDHRHRTIDADFHDLASVRRVLAQTDKFPVLVPDLSDAGFELDGVCRCFHEEGVRVVHAYYRRGDESPEVVSVFSVDQKFALCKSERCACRSREHTDYEVATVRNVTVCKWDDKCASFAVCGQMRADQLQQLADTMQLVVLEAATPAIAWAD